MYTQDDYIFGYRNSLFFNRRRSYEMKNIGPVFPQVIYRKKAWIFVTCLEQMQRWPLSRDTEYFQKN